MATKIPPLAGKIIGIFIGRNYPEMMPEKD
jgi:hypothetical protein